MFELELVALIDFALIKCLRNIRTRYLKIYERVILCI